MDPEGKSAPYEQRPPLWRGSGGTADGFGGFGDQRPAKLLTSHGRQKAGS